MHSCYKSCNLIGWKQVSKCDIGLQDSHIDLQVFIFTYNFFRSCLETSCLYLVVHVGKAKSFDVAYESIRITPSQFALIKEILKRTLHVYVHVLSFFTDEYMCVVSLCINYLLHHRLVLRIGSRHLKRSLLSRLSPKMIQWSALNGESKKT